MAGNRYCTPDTIRLFLLDRTGSDNFLLDDVDFEDPLLDLAQTLAVDRYNTTDPFLDEVYTVQDFPFRVEFLLGVTAFLLRSKSLSLKRNQLNYSSSAGTAVDDKAQANDYASLAVQFQQEFDQRVRKIKTQKNVSEGYGYVDSRYSDLGATW